MSNQCLAAVFVFAGMMCLKPCFGQGQNNQGITLQYCQNQAISTYPLAKDKSLLQAAYALKISNADANKLPQMNFGAQATYQSNAIDITLPLQNGTKSIKQSKDQYKVSFEVTQLLYDGGATKFQHQIEEASLATDAQQIDVDLYKIKEQVNNVYFLILSLQENQRLLQTTLAEIGEKEKIVASSVRNGILTASDLDALTAEKLKAEQQIAEIDINRKAALQILSLLVNQPISDSTKFEVPDVAISDTAAIKRPEYKLFDLQSQRIDGVKQMTNTVLKPKAFAFAQGGYGRPGLNMLSDQFAPYYIVGATIKWNLMDGGRNKRDKQLLDIQKQMVATRRETFDKTLNIDLQNKRSSVQRFEEALKRDEQIVELRSRIARTAASKLDNGTITSTDYLTELNAETIAKINLENHKLQLLLAKANYLVAKGQM